ncbi:helix-turn-helix domain-containing protein, partial [Campylobacter upsaliensis]
DIETKEIFYCIEWHDTNEEINFNIIKRVCKEQGLTYKQLGELIGYSESAIKSAMVKNEISEPMNKAVQMQLEIIKLKRELRLFKKFKNFIKQISK